MKTDFRPMQESDIPFLTELYISTRWEELQPVPWTDEEKLRFLRWQFEAQHTHYQKYFPNARFDIISYKKKPIGRLYLDQRENEIRVVDIALLPPYRGKGIGSRLLKNIMADAQASNRTVTIHVEQNNPAMRLYERLGFTKINEEGIYWLMEWKHD